MSHRQLPPGPWTHCRAPPMPMIIDAEDSGSSVGMIPQACMVFRSLPPTPEHSVRAGSAAPRGASTDSESSVTDGAYDVIYPPGAGLGGGGPRGVGEPPQGAGPPLFIPRNDSQFTVTSGRSLLSDPGEYNVSHLEKLRYEHICICRRTFVLIFVCIYTFLLLATSAFCLWFYLNYTSERMDNMSSIQRLKQNNSPPTVCVPCQKLARETKADISLLKTYTDRNVCKVRTDLAKPLVLNLEGSICTSNASEITELMKSVVMSEFGRDFHHKQNDMEEKITTIQERLDALGHINSSRPFNIPLVTPLPRTTTTKRPTPVAHVIGTCSKTSPGTRGSDCELHWEDDPSSSQSHINKGGVTLEDGYLKVPRPGYYYVYSQLCFNVHTNRQGHATFEHFLQRNCAIPLSDNRHILFQNWKHINLQTSHEHCSYLGGVVEMVRGCGVVVTVTGGQFLTPNKHMNYFGLYFIEGKEQM